ncbi:alcohol dehydrogenase zinc-binding domain-containing protein [Corynebacterium kutscheri]|uniref:Alcohol dehydrogenase zinc-binding domain-containing protein n=1 Tax=Corynebacterium kutscheri TaxID=35755 RepID=A0A0F6QXZ1_9CORY|nr:Zinc-binding dehydrogenase [Corynebacterium kutscheri]VEH05524.1 alcohol dehydrogenase zinc-binding domain-containing protein [Corynebacterium kutscheri]VEH10674.1 alcohol dehydrogenase zinc-binding domain-containing protein [Corynebacterium kutscheri]VEH81415.1 alcohol dehydrogenase zinc-binding domain-containing protein [Corynebacterium kutscheri]
MGPGRIAAVVGDGAVGLSAVIAAKEMGAERIIVFSRHADRQRLAREFGATDIIEARGEEGVAQLKELTGGLGAHCVIEAVGSKQAIEQAIGSCRPGGHIGYVGVSHDATLDMGGLFFSQVHLMGGPAAVRKFLPQMIELIYQGKIEPGKVFDQVLPLEQAAEGYRMMDQREATKVLLTV